MNDSFLSPSNDLLYPLNSIRKSLSQRLQVYPSGQRGRAQDPMRSASQVRILPPAPLNKIKRAGILDYLLRNSMSSSKNSIVPYTPRDLVR